MDSADEGSVPRLDLQVLLFILFILLVFSFFFPWWCIGFLVEVWNEGESGLIGGDFFESLFFFFVSTATELIECACWIV